MSRTKKQSDSQVLIAAFDTIAREGFSSFTFTQVSKAVGLSPSALVKRFKNKDQLALLARNLKWEQNLGEINSEDFSQLSGLTGIYDFLTLISRSVNSHRLGEHAMWLGKEACHPRSKKKVAVYFEKTRQIFSQFLQQAIKNNELNKIEDIKTFAKTMEALLQGAIFQFAFLDERNIEFHLKDHFDVLLEPYKKNQGCLNG
jgi:AcrR family transcriptional regulator